MTLDYACDFTIQGSRRVYLISLHFPSFAHHLICHIPPFNAVRHSSYARWQRTRARYVSCSSATIRRWDEELIHQKPRFLPDPNKWIQTAPTSSTKKAQRPLTSIRNGFATPPTTIKRPTSSTNTQVKDQGSIVGNGFFTPTPKNVEDSGKKRGDPSTTVKAETTSRTSRLAVRADEVRSSPTDDIELDTKNSSLRNQHQRPSPSTRPKVVPLKTHHSAPVSSSSGMSDALDQDQRTPPRKRRRTTSLSPLFPPGSPVASHMSSDRPITPVPDYVLEIHRRLCGREFTRRKSPTTGSPAKTKTKSRKEREREKERKAIDERAHDRALARRRNREKENEHRLVVGSSPSNGDMPSPKQDGKHKRTFSPVDIPTLAPMVVNTVHHSPLIKHDTPRAPRRRETSHRDAFSPSAVYEELCNPTPPQIHTPPISRQLRRTPTGTSPRSAIPITSPSPSPAPKSITPAEAKMPPAGPHPRDFEAVPMQAETLLSWGGDTRTPTRPEPRPMQHHQPGPDEVDSTETQSVCPLSQASGEKLINSWHLLLRLSLSLISFLPLHDLSQCLPTSIDHQPDLSRRGRV